MCAMYSREIESEPGIEVTEQPMRACADCNLYAIARNMITMRDGRRVCQTCKNIARAKAERSEQIRLFGQTSIFDGLL